MMKCFRLAFAVLLTMNVASVVEGITPERFADAVDVLACRATRATLPPDRFTLFDRSFACEKPQAFKATDISEFVKNDDKTLRLLAEAESIKKTEVADWDDQKVLSFLTDQIFANDSKYPEFAAFAERRRLNSKFDTFALGLKNSIEAFLGSMSIEGPGATLPKPNATGPSSIQTVDGGTSWLPSVGSLVLISVLFVLALAIGYLFFDQRRLHAQLVALIDVGRGRNNAGSGSRSSEDARLKEIESIKSRIDKVESGLRALQMAEIKSRAPERQREDYELRPAMVEERFTPRAPRVEIFYMSSPKPDGSFDAHSARDSFKEGYSIYRFEKSSQTRAEFRIDESEAAAAIALQFRDKTIDPVCDAVNVFDPSMRRIVTETSGTADLEGESWVFRTKARIRYEH